jgi:ribonuclease HI
LYTDSQYLITMATGGKAKKNGDLVERLRQAMQCHEVTVHHVNGHAGHPENERVDWLAQRQAEQAKRAARAH